MRPHGCLLLVKLLAGKGEPPWWHFATGGSAPAPGGKARGKESHPGGEQASLVPQPSRNPRPRDVGGIRVGVCTTDRSALAVHVEGGAGPGPSSAGAKGRAWVPAQVSVVGYLLWSCLGRLSPAWSCHGGSGRC